MHENIRSPTWISNLQLSQTNANLWYFRHVETGPLNDLDDVVDVDSIDEPPVKKTRDDLHDAKWQYWNNMRAFFENNTRDNVTKQPVVSTNSQCVTAVPIEHTFMDLYANFMNRSKVDNVVKPAVEQLNVSVKANANAVCTHSAADDDVVDEEEEKEDDSDEEDDDDDDDDLSRYIIPATARVRVNTASAPLPPALSAEKLTDSSDNAITSASTVCAPLPQALPAEKLTPSNALWPQATIDKLLERYATEVCVVHPQQHDIVLIELPPVSFLPHSFLILVHCREIN